MSQLPLYTPSSLSVSELTTYLRQLLEGDELLQDVTVQGEVATLSRPSSGHIYFTLVDASAGLRCVMWKSTALRLRGKLDEFFRSGAAVEAHGYISLYERDGQYQLYVDDLRPAGIGLLYQEFMRLKERLEAEGLFDLERKRPIPPRPQTIGVVTSTTAAALQDVIRTVQARNPLAQLILAPAAVQGAEAPAEIVRALRALNARRLPEVILLVRGGGSLEDLWAFNDERVVRAVAASAIPVVSGVGHEIDFTLADFAADERAPTPTGAAALVTAGMDVLSEENRQLNSRLCNAAQSLVQYQRDQLESLQIDLGRSSPLRRVLNNRQQLDGLTERSQRTTAQQMRLLHAHWQGTAQRLQALNPLAVLQRGFAVVSDSDGKLIRSVAQAQAGQRLRIQVSDGAFHARTEPES